MIKLITGLPGHGKTALSVRLATEALQRGTPVASNVNLVDGWERRIANRDPTYWIRPFLRRRWLRNAPSLFHYAEDREELFSIRLQGSREGRGIMLLDEGADWLNARSWGKGDREAVVRFFSQHRKLGWNVILVAQHAEQLDKQVRNLVEEHTVLRNLRKTAKIAGIPVCPMNLFFAITVWPGAQRIVLRRQFFRVNWRTSLYDTHATTEGWAEAAPEDHLWLPSPPEGRPQRGAGSGAAAATPGPAPREDVPTADEDAAEAGESDSWAAQKDFSEAAIPTGRVVASSTKKRG